MFEHFILIHSDYSAGRRIAFHQVYTNVEGIKDFKKLTDKLKSSYPELSFGFHHVKTDSQSWESVVEYDKFFEDVFPATGFESFMRFLDDDEKITSFDIANLITSKIECTHLKLQKLLYFFYERYVRRYNEAPFEEKIVAWRLGPVIEEVYNSYKKYGSSNISDMTEDNHVMINKDDEFKLSVYSRFMQTADIGRYLEVLDEVLNEYKGYDAFSLVEITHQPGTPWHDVTHGGKKLNRVIHENIITNFAKNH